LLDELIECLGREALTSQRDPLCGIQRVATGGADTEILPSLLLGAEEGSVEKISG
jgi:hypothetical protein